MTLSKRKFLFSSFVVAFFVIAALTILYAQGYRFNFGWPPRFDQVLQRNGMLLVETDPGGATLLLDGETPRSWWQERISGEEGKIETPAKIKDIKPEEYTLTLYRDGYHTWEKEIDVHPGRITNITKLRLVKKDLPLKLSETKINKELISPDKKRAVAISGSKIVNLTSGEAVSIPAASSSEISWSPDGEKLITGKKIFDVEREEVALDLEEKLPEQDMKRIKWNPRGDEIYYTHDDQLHSLDPKTGVAERIFPEKKDIVAYLPTHNFLYLIRNSSNHSIMEVYAYPGPKIRRSIELPLSLNYQIKTTPRDNIISVYDKEFRSLYLLNPLSPVSVLERSLDNVSDLHWKNNSEMIYARDFEIRKLNLNASETELITRISKRIKGVFGDPRSNNVIYYTDNGVKMIEPRAKKLEVTELMKLNHISDLYLGDGDSTLYFNADIGNQSGLYKLSIY